MTHPYPNLGPSGESRQAEGLGNRTDFRVSLFSESQQ
jgi:hypothetical protein